MTTSWNNEGSHFVPTVGRRCQVVTFHNSNGYWTAAVLGQFSTYGVTRGNAIRNACKPVDRIKAQAALDEYNAHRKGLISDADYLASIHASHAANLEAFWADARAHGETQ
ncbi:hypothetical protein NKK48_01365 [Mesorhizobium sp. C386A]|uniref:hypothetical protein n=1 Tax=unclassified Mesorhizobium TaxID=325217 RepID=UPI0003CEA06B|nr:hypothetical protein [Mesorhizobium sp. LNJC386A00]ESY35730.1 hypothetical protein X748_14040 [Mesorhizobium sp. LNJC386A00]